MLSGACGPKDFEEASDDDDEGAPFGDTGMAKGGSMPSGGTSGAGPGCGTVTEVGMCDGFIITFCDEGELTTGDCRTLDPSCTCGFSEEFGANDCICDGGGAGGTGGMGGMGAVGGAGAMGGAGARGGTAGTGGGMAGMSGAAGNGGTAGAGGMCGGLSCMNHNECCTDFQCVSFEEAAPVCAANCVQNTACQSGCCATLSDYTGACGPASACGGTGCRPLGTSCDTAADCCALTSGGAARCVDVGRGGPRVCSAPCTTAANCASMCCHLDAFGVRACAPAEICQ